MCKYCSKRCTSALISFSRFIASSFILSLFPRQWVLWEQEAASSSLATPTTRKATIQRRKWQLYRGFICCINARNRLESATKMRQIQKRPVLCDSVRPYCEPGSASIAIQKNRAAAFFSSSEHPSRSHGNAAQGRCRSTKSPMSAKTSARFVSTRSSCRAPG